MVNPSGQVHRHVEYETKLNFYNEPPQLEIKLEEFETLALARLKVLKALEAADLRNQPQEEVIKAYRKEATEHLPLLSNDSPELEKRREQRRNDHISHFILRLAYCRSEILRQWFIKYETLLFRIKFEEEKGSTQDLFLKANDLHLEILSDTEKRHFEKEIRSSSFVEDFEQEPFYKVPFDKVAELVQRRQVFIYQGFAYVPRKDRVILVVDEFQKRLQLQLEATAKALPRMEEDDRIIPVLNNMSKQYIGDSYQSKSSLQGKVTANDIDKLSSQFPLCMKHLHDKLRQDKHLRHGGRMQYGLFLKGLGLSIEEALVFWKRAFSKISDDQFQKNYAYNIRHNYGREGRRKDYTPYSCIRIITGNHPSTGDHHGCPFRHFSSENLARLIKSNSPHLSESDVKELVGIQKEHPQIACTRYLELSKGQRGVESISHPNQYFELAVGPLRSSPVGY